MTMLANGGRPAARLITGAHQRTAGLYLALREAAASDTDLARRLREVEERRLVSAEQGLSSTGYSTSHPKRRRKGEGHEGHQAGRDRPDVPHGGDRRCAGGGGVAGRRRRYPDRCVEPRMPPGGVAARGDSGGARCAVPRAEPVGLAAVEPGLR